MIRDSLALLIALPPALNVLLKITLILALGWLLHFALLRANPRWRVLLWRGVLLGVLAAPLIAIALPIIRISLPQAPAAPVQALPAPEMINAPPLTEDFVPPARAPQPIQISAPAHHRVN